MALALQSHRTCRYFAKKNKLLSGRQFLCIAIQGQNNYEVSREPAAGSGKKCLKSRQPVPEKLLNRTGKRLNFDPEQWKLNLTIFREKNKTEYCPD